MEDQKKPDRRTMEDEGVFLLSGEIHDDSVADAIEWILESNMSGGHQHLTLIINSPGGDVYSGFALIDTMSGSVIPVHTVGLGCIASMGLLIFLAGRKGHRTLTPNTTIMSHQWWGASFGKEHELISNQKHHDQLSKMIIRHYKKHTGLSEKKIRDNLLPPSDVWLTADEAKDLGICDRVSCV